MNGTPASRGLEKRLLAHLKRHGPARLRALEVDLDSDRREILAAAACLNLDRREGRLYPEQVEEDAPSDESLIEWVREHPGVSAEEARTIHRRGVDRLNLSGAIVSDGGEPSSLYTPEHAASQGIREATQIAARREELLDLAVGGVTSKGVAESLGLSCDTARRRLRWLAESGWLQRDRVGPAFLYRPAKETPMEVADQILSAIREHGPLDSPGVRALGIAPRYAAAYLADMAKRGLLDREKGDEDLWVYSLPEAEGQESDDDASERTIGDRILDAVKAHGPLAARGLREHGIVKHPAAYAATMARRGRLARERGDDGVWVYSLPGPNGKPVASKEPPSSAPKVVEVEAKKGSEEEAPEEDPPEERPAADDSRSVRLIQSAETHGTVGGLVLLEPEGLVIGRVENGVPHAHWHQDGPPAWLAFTSDHDAAALLARLYREAHDGY